MVSEYVAVLIQLETYNMLDASISVLHVMTLTQQSAIRAVQDYSFDSDVSRPMQNSVVWIPNSLGLDVSPQSSWNYRYLV